MGKIVKKDNIQQLISEIKGKKSVMTNGCFDILHVGHVRYLNESKKLGDILIVAVNSDASVRALKGKDRPINTENDRMEVLSALEAVDYVVLFDELTPVNLLDTIKPSVYTKGADYNLQNLKEAETVIKNGGTVEFIKLVEGKSTTKIIDKIK